MSREIVLKKLIFFSVLIMMTFSLSAQVLINPFHRDAYFFSFDQLFEFSALNQSTNSHIGYFQLNISDASRGNLIVSVKSLPMALAEQQFINSNDIQWGNNIQLGANSIADEFGNTGNLPVGDYLICYYFFSNNNVSQLGQYCYEKPIGVEGQFELISPYDKEIISNPFPLLYWSTLRPFMFGDTSFDLVLTEKKPRQSNQEALISNLKILEIQNISGTFLPYPISARELEIGKTYVWQVKAKQFQSELAISDVWQFTYDLEANIVVERTSEPKGFKFPKEKMDDSYYLANGEVNFVYNNISGQDILDYSLIPQSFSGEQLDNLPNITLKRGLNKITLNGDTIVGLKKEEIYVLKIYNGDLNPTYLKFIYYDKR